MLFFTIYAILPLQNLTEALQERFFGDTVQLRFLKQKLNTRSNVIQNIFNRTAQDMRKRHHIRYICLENVLLPLLILL